MQLEEPRPIHGAGVLHFGEIQFAYDPEVAGFGIANQYIRHGEVFLSLAGMRRHDVMLDHILEFQQEIPVLRIVFGLQRLIAGKSANARLAVPVGDGEKVGDRGLVSPQDRHVEVAGHGTVIGNGSLFEKVSVGVSLRARCSAVPYATGSCSVHIQPVMLKRSTWPNPAPANAHASVSRVNNERDCRNRRGRRQYGCGERGHQGNHAISGVEQNHADS